MKKTKSPNKHLSNSASAHHLQNPPDSLLIEPKPMVGSPSFWPLFFKATSLAIFFAFIMLLITATVVAGYFYRKIQVVSQESGLSIQELKSIAEAGLHSQPVATEMRKNILLLGTDALPNRGTVPELTDTMMLISVNLQTGHIYTLPIPRDLWSTDYKTKINSLYAYGKERYPDTPERFPTEVLSQMTGITIHHTLVLSIANVSNLIDTLGGVKVEVPDSFTDTEFPRSDVNIQVERDPKKLYETVTFTKGVEVMTGERAVTYIRSRHSEGDTGTDIDRGKRQQQVIDALVKKLLNKKTLTNADQVGKLIAFYNQNFSKSFPMTEVVATVKTLYPVKDQITHQSSEITVYPKNPTGSITNPPIKKYNQWVYEVRDITTFKKEVQKNLGILE